jgi:hypothetical protein
MQHILKLYRVFIILDYQEFQRRHFLRCVQNSALNAYVRRHTHDGRKSRRDRPRNPTRPVVPEVVRTLAMSRLAIFRSRGLMRSSTSIF